MKYLFILFLCVSCSAKFCGNSDTMLKRYDSNGFSNSENNIITYEGKPFAKLQAMTFSLDDNKLVREINVKLYSGIDISKIPNLIKFIHMKHHNAEVEVEMEMN